MAHSSVDRLSGLPDDVICHILSFLPTKTSASTSVLARRWRFLWAQVPSLDFNGDDFEDDEVPQASDIINRVLLLHRAKTINSFSLSRVNWSWYQIDTWIAHIVNCGVRNLYLDFPGDHGCPTCLLTCKTLVELRLLWCEGIPSRGKVFLPSLKKLHLSRIAYENDDSLPRLLSGCPVLEDLIVEGYYKHNPNDDDDYDDDDDDDDDDLGCVFVSSPTLKTLNADLLEGSPYLKINTPSLVYLTVKNCCLEHITSLTAMTSLMEADFSLLGEKVIDSISVQFLNFLCNVKCLKITLDNVIEKLVDIAGLESMAMFENLTKLESELMIDFHELVKFLEVADNLEFLAFTLGGMHYTYRQPKQVPSCMLSRLKIVRINSFLGINVHSFKTIRYVLRNAQVLRRMEIHSSSFRSSSKLELEMLRRIPLLHRGSESCQIVFC